MPRPFSNLTRSANAVRRNVILLSKGVYNEPDYYAENNRIGGCAWFNSDGRVPSTKAPTETFTVYEDALTLKLLDLGPPGNSPGDVYHFFAPLHSTPGGPVTGEVFGSKTLIKMATDASPNLETRATVLFFTFANRQDEIVALGARDYPPTAGEFDACQPVLRAILGGTGKYMGARGQLASTRNADGSYTQVFTLLK
jgi:hypothetical protein